MEKSLLLNKVQQPMSIRRQLDNCGFYSKSTTLAFSRCMNRGAECTIQHKDLINWPQRFALLAKETGTNEWPLVSG